MVLFKFYIIRDNTDFKVTLAIKASNVIKAIETFKDT